MKYWSKWWCVRHSTEEQHLACFILCTGHCRMFLILNGPRTWTLTRTHDLEALTGDTKKKERGRGWGSPTLTFHWAPRLQTIKVSDCFRTCGKRYFNLLCARVCSCHSNSSPFLHSTQPVTAHSQTSDSIQKLNNVHIDVKQKKHQILSFEKLRLVNHSHFHMTNRVLCQQEQCGYAT